MLLTQNTVTWSRQFIRLINSTCQGFGKRQFSVPPVFGALTEVTFIVWSDSKKLRAGIIQFGRHTLKMSSLPTYVLPRLAQDRHSSVRTQPEYARGTAAKARSASSIRLDYLAVCDLSLEVWEHHSNVLPWSKQTRSLSRFQGSYTDPTAQWDSNQDFAVTFKPATDGFLCIRLLEMPMEHYCLSFPDEKVKAQRSFLHALCLEEGAQICYLSSPLPFRHATATWADTSIISLYSSTTELGSLLSHYTHDLHT